MEKRRIITTKDIIQNLEKECLQTDCRAYKCDDCLLIKKSIKLFGIDLLRCEY